MSKSELEIFLEEQGMAQYLPLFNSNSIGMAELPGLTADDLKELGISALGHRKALLAAIQARGGGNVQAPPDQPPSAPGVPAAPVIREEKTYLEMNIGIVNGQYAAIKVTNRRAILGDKTYALQNIAAVEAYSNESEIDKQYKAALEGMKDLRLKNRLILGGSGLAMLGIAATAVTSKDGGSVAACCGMLGVGLILVGFRNIKDPERDKPVWAVRIQASGTSNDVVQSLNRAQIEKVVAALNEAIVNLNM